MRMGREPDRHRVVVFDQLIRKRGQLVAVYSRVDQKHTGMSPHDHRIALHEVALVHHYVLGDLPQHNRSPPLTGLGPNRFTGQIVGASDAKQPLQRPSAAGNRWDLQSDLAA